MDSKFTKGKWKQVESGIKLYTNIICGETRIAEVKHYNDPEDLDNKFLNDPLFLEGKANAKLIASAPEMFEMLKQAKTTICRLRLSISVHPDCEENSEFADYVDLADEKEKQIKQLLTKITENDN